MNTRVPRESSVLGLRGVVPDEAPLRILLLNPSKLFAEMLRRRLTDADDVVGVSTASTADEALRVLAEEPFAVVVSTAELARDLWESPRRREYPISGVPVVVLADGQDRHQARDLFRHGVVGWVSRAKSTADLLEAVRTCRRGDVCIPQDVLALLTEVDQAHEVRSSSRERVLSQLTQRERQVFLLLERGLGRTDIAAELHLSPNTVRTHIHRILRRLEVHSTLAALALARAGEVPIS